jgi:catechol 2,3-dioxygenase-like lactoylglutathione lyase family enzyme
MAVKGLNHIALKSRDLKKTEDFYTDVLGLKVAIHPACFFSRPLVAPI